ncbi:MAG: 2-oxoacid:acceptor oxidoreductase family protein [Candidatus Omnitrophica bacterium]|nr:2-oxoacid:acceptor oxidoreductase family protein [Candidatus Omnitrophota bacterium]
MRSGLPFSGIKREMKTFNILFAGIGGQGVLKASELCGLAAVIDGYHVKKSEVHGMAQRGGSVESHLRFGKLIYSPLIPMGEADFLVAFHSGENERLTHFLKAQGINLTAYLERAHSIVSDKRFVNTFMLGILSVYLPIKERSWLMSIEKIFLSGFVQENKHFFLQGRNLK